VKVGDLVKDTYAPGRITEGDRYGIITGEVPLIERGFGFARMFNVLWRNGVVMYRVLHSDLEVISESESR